MRYGAPRRGKMRNNFVLESCTALRTKIILGEGLMTPTLKKITIRLMTSQTVETALSTSINHTYLVLVLQTYMIKILGRTLCIYRYRFICVQRISQFLSNFNEDIQQRIIHEFDARFPEGFQRPTKSFLRTNLIVIFWF